MPKQRFGLGRGIDALIPGTQPIADDRVLDTSLSVSALFEVPIEAVVPNAQQPRAAVEDDQELLELADSIQQYGLLQPLLVALEGEDEAGARYQLIAGERRWRAAQLAGLEQVPVVIKEATPQQMLEMALVENLQRSDLNPLEEAAGYQSLIEEYRLTQEEVAQRVGRNRATIANTIRLLQLPDEVREALVRMPKVFTEGHARAVLMIGNDAQRIEATKQIIARRESVRGAEELARRYNAASLRLAPDQRAGKERNQNYETRVLEEEFTRAVQMKVRLQRTTKGKGSLTLFFTNEEQLQLLYQWLVQQQRQQQGADAVASLLSANGFDLADLNTLANGANGHAANGADGDDGADEG